jgi:hypothetical protein
MKSLTSLILPKDSIFRYLKGGRMGLGFKGSQLVTKDEDGNVRGVTVPLPGTVQNITADPASLVITKRFTYITYAAGTAAVVLPPVAGSLRYITIIKNGANGCTATKATADAANICLSGAAAASLFTIATGTSATFVSDGTYWYRVASST